MRYILNDEGYIETISFNYQIECNNKTCTEYTGSVPTGYESLAEWNELANINAYKVVNGELTYDSDKDTELQSLWATQKAENNISINDSSLLVDKTNIIPIIPLVGSNFGNYGNSYYYKIGSKVHVHLGLSSLTAKTNNNIFTLPEGYRPKDAIAGTGVGGALSEITSYQVWNTGAITVYPQSTGYVLTDFEFDAFN